MKVFISFLLLLLTENYFVHADTTSCKESQRLFADLCFSPTASEQLDVEWLLSSQPEAGWNTDLGNDVFRYHTFQLLKGKILKADEIDEDEKHYCLKTKFGSDESGNIVGDVTGFQDLSITYNCTFSEDFALVQKCDLISNIKSKYHEAGDFYVSYSDNKNFYINILCYATGQVGWNVHSITRTLTDQEKEEIFKHVESLGFKRNTTVSLYRQNCPN